MLIDSVKLETQISNSTSLLSFQKESLLHIIKSLDDEGSIREGLPHYYWEFLDFVFYRLTGNWLSTLSPSEDVEVNYAIQDFCSRLPKE